MKFRKLRPDEIECRVSTIKSNGLSLLLYKDARCDMNMLDEIVGMEYWQRDHKEIKNVVYCGVSIFIEDRWVTKWDAGAESFTEKQKGEASDSFKRACFNWGIGRELYTAPFIWIKPDNDKEFIKKDNGKVSTYSKFNVDEIEYKEDKITYLVIKDQNGKVRYKLGNKPVNKNVVKELLDLNIKIDDMYKWFDHFNIKYEETDTLADVCSRLQAQDAQFIIDRFNKHIK